MDKEESKEPQKKKKINDLDRELDQTFPASDPPSHTRPGQNRKTKEKEEEEDKNK